MLHCQFLFVNTEFKTFLSSSTNEEASERESTSVVKRARERMKREAGDHENKAVNQKNETSPSDCITAVTF